MVTSGSLSQVSGASAAIFNNLKQSSNGAADRLGKAGKGFFSKITRSGSTNERELINDDSYVCSVINLPLIDQARKTRICKKLEDCRDKLNFGCLLSHIVQLITSTLRAARKRVFTEYQVVAARSSTGKGDLILNWTLTCLMCLTSTTSTRLGPCSKLGFVNFPTNFSLRRHKTRFAQQCEGATTAPQLLKDELSKLPPYNYYLLFAITCHLNLLHSYVDQNKMDYRNLCICFQPCMKIDAFCFQFLVCDWKNCWQGCWTEKEYVQKEMEMDELEQKAAEAKEATRAKPEPPRSAPSAVSHERAVSSGSSSSERLTALAKSQRSSHLDQKHLEAESPNRRTSTLAIQTIQEAYPNFPSLAHPFHPSRSRLCSRLITQIRLLIWTFRLSIFATHSFTLR